MNDLAPIVLFVYNRPKHTKKVLDALSSNPESQNSLLYIFCDGPKENSDLRINKKINTVRRIVEKEKRFKEVIISYAKSNLGLASSIINGVSYVVEKHNSVIVLEDDILPSIGFLKYMNDSLSLYKNESKVGCIHAWNYAICPTSKSNDTFFLKGADCWGWATWKRAWDLFEPDGNKLLKIINQDNSRFSFDRNGTHEFYKMLIDQINGKIDSWAIRWHASLFVNNMYCLHPYKPIVKNIGFDNAGTHTKNEFIPQYPIVSINLKKIKIEEYQQFFSLYKEYLEDLKKHFINFLPLRKKFKILFKRLFKKKQKCHKVKDWDGNYESWEQASNLSTGYNSDLILEKCKTALLKIKNGEAVYERDSVIFNEIQYAWELLFALQNIKHEFSGDLCVLDFGGSLGSSYYQNKSMLSDYGTLKWCIVEQPQFVECGKRFFENNQLLFFNSIDECLNIQKPNVLLMSSVLQYLSEPYDFINIVNNLRIPYIVFDRTTFIEGGDDLITIQTVPKEIYEASYPCWFFSYDKIISNFTNYILISEFDSFCDPLNQTINDNQKIFWKGFVLKLKNEF